MKDSRKLGIGKAGDKLAKRIVLLCLASICRRADLLGSERALYLPFDLTFDARTHVFDFALR